MQITSEIFQIGGEELSHNFDASIYLIKSGSSAFLVDAGSGNGHKEVIRNIEETGTSIKNIRYIFLTHSHYDHTGGAQKLKLATGAEIIAHELDAQYLENGDSEVTAASWYGTQMDPFNVDIKVKGQKKIFKLPPFEIYFYHTPGHSPGSSVLTVKSDSQLVLFGQDIHGPLNEVLKSNRNDYTESLEFLLSLDADILCEGHFGVFKGREKVKKFIELYL